MIIYDFKKFNCRIKKIEKKIQETDENNRNRTKIRYRVENSVEANFLGIDVSDFEMLSYMDSCVKTFEKKLLDKNNPGFGNPKKGFINFEPLSKKKEKGQKPILTLRAYLEKDDEILEEEKFNFQQVLMLGNAINKCLQNLSPEIEERYEDNQ